MDNIELNLNEPRSSVDVHGKAKKPVKLKLEIPGETLKFSVGKTAISTGVQSVNGKTGRVILDANDVGAYSKDEIDLRITSGIGAPTSETIGVLGTIYNDTETGNKYVCTSVTEEGGQTIYQWERKKLPIQGVIEKDNTGYVSGGQVWEYNEQNIVFRRF